MKYIIIFALIIGSMKSHAQENNTLWTAAWSPNDDLIAVGGDEGVLRLFDGETFELLNSYPVGGVTISRVKWHPGQNKLAVITQSDSFKAKILDLDRDEWIELDGLENSLRALDWNHSGEMLAISDYDGNIVVFEINGKRISRFNVDPKSVTGLDWHPTENILTVVGSRIGVFHYMGDTIRIFQPREFEVLLLCVEWHESGEFYAIGDYGDAENAENKLIQYWSADGKLLAEMGDSFAEYRNIRWSPNGKYLASANDALRIWNRKGKLIREAESSDDYLWGVDWNSDGSRIVTSSSEGVIAVWDKDLTLIRLLEY